MDDNGLMLRFGNETHARLYFFILVFTLTGLWQYLRRFRPSQQPIQKRWLNHLGLALTNLVFLRILFAGSALWAARVAARHSWGLFHKMEVDFLFSVVFTVVFLDWMTYYLHRMYHAIPFLWNIHRTHHTDPEVETSTGVRFHPLEQMLSSIWRGLFIILLGAPFSGVFIYEVLLTSSNLFNHTNARLPEFWDSLVRTLFVTPDMHRVHHSAEAKETNSNFGFILSLWDRILMTYRAKPEKGQEGVVLGLQMLREPQDQTILNLLKQPFLDSKGQFKWSNLWNKEPAPQGLTAKAGSE